MYPMFNECASPNMTKVLVLLNKPSLVPRLLWETGYEARTSHNKLAWYVYFHTIDYNWIRIIMMHCPCTAQT